MDLRVLHYFLTVAKEQSFTKASEQLHITQPTLSRQIAALEEELETILFVRGSRTVTLTPEGLLLRRRAMEMVELEERTLEEFRNQNDLIEGRVTIGCGEFSTVETLAEICASFQRKYPRVQIALHTATADVVYEKMNQGLIDIGLFLEPVNTEGMDYLSFPKRDYWAVAMRPDDPLAEKETITREDLLGKPLILPERTGVQSELANWFGKDFEKLQVSFVSNFGTNSGIMVAAGLGYLVSIPGAIQYWSGERIVLRRLYPEISAGTLIAWRRNIPYSKAVSKFIEELQINRA